MAATIKPPHGERKSRPIRFNSMESLGFSDSFSMWSDSPQMLLDEEQAATPEPQTLADWQPEDFGTRLDGRDFRWGIAIGLVVVVLAIVAFGYWLYQRPAVEAEASVSAVAADAEDLSSAIFDLEQFNEELVATGAEPETALLFAVDDAARELFEASGELPGNESATRSAAAAASSAVLDGVRLAGDAHSYRLAVTPVLAVPDFETDPSLIELDEAARVFGDWQLRFDDVRTALPDGVLPDVTEQLDVLGGDLTMILGDYVDALRQDNAGAATSVLSSLAARLDGIGEELTISVADAHDRVSQRIAEARAALDSLARR